jgi:6,7-dimethyl-8-ribityllumazine synthase
MRPTRGSRRGRKGLRVGIVVSRFNGEITRRLLDGALTALDEAGVSKRRLKVVSVPGAFEIPGAAARMAAGGDVDAIVCLGAVIRGETEHYEYVAAAAQQGVLRVGLDSVLPVTFGVLTTENADQALERSGGELGNKGYEAALDAVEMADLYRKLG